MVKIGEIIKIIPFAISVPGHFNYLNIKFLNNFIFNQGLPVIELLEYATPGGVE